MPLKEGYSASSIEKNIKSEAGKGKPHKQAVAIALDVARRAKKRRAKALRKMSGT